MEPLTLSNFRSKFYSNEGNFFNVIPTALTKIDGTEVLGGEDALRLFFEMGGEPTGKETIEIKPSGGLSIFNLNGDAMESGQSTGQIKLGATVQSIISMEMAVDNSYVDVTFNMGVYGDSNRLEPVTKDDFVLAFMQNGGSATSVVIKDITRVDGTTLQGGETELRFNLNIMGSPNGDEAVEIWAAIQSVYSPSGIAMSHYRSSGQIKLSPPKPELISIELASDNSYLDITFNTGVYGDWYLNEDKPCGIDPVKIWNFRVFFTGGGADSEFGWMSSVKKDDYSVESKAGELKGGERTIRIFLDIKGVPTGEEYIIFKADGIFNKKGVLYDPVVEDTYIKMNALTLGFELPWLEWNNRYIDLNFTSGVYGSIDCTTPVAIEDFTLIYDKNDGLTENVIIEAVTQPDSVDIAKATPLIGGEKTVRAFLKLSNPSAGQGETIEIKPADGSSIWNGAGIPMDENRTTKKINLFASRPGIISYKLARDNSYIDLHFNFGVYLNCKSKVDP